MLGFRGRFVAFFTILLLVPGGIWAQGVRSGIGGRVVDGTGAVVPDAVVEVRRLDTGAVRRGETDGAGRFWVAGLEGAEYEVEVARDGFRRSVRRGLRLTVGGQLDLRVTLEVGERTEQLEVRGEGPRVEMSDAQLSGVTGEASLRELPLNGRDLFQLVALQPGLTQATNAGTIPFNAGLRARASVAGTRPVMNNITLDGADINDPAYNLTPGGAAGLQLGVEAVREFRVVVNPVSAEFGRNAGANVQYVTKSGTNEWHGAGYEYLRNARLDARNFFDPEVKPRFVRNQFGASLGGSLRRNRTFVFANY
jgi:Carboxypeptidase regulatory-like domain